MLILAGLVAGALATTAYAQDTGTVRGEVTFIASGDQVHGAVVLVVGRGADRRERGVRDSGLFADFDHSSGGPR